MSLILDDSSAKGSSTSPFRATSTIKIEIRTTNFNLKEFLQLSDGGCVSLDDAVCMIEYILDNTDLVVNDPRRDFLARIKKATIIEGYNGVGSTRIKIPILRPAKR